MADGLAWDDLTPELEAPGVGIRRADAGGLATCIIRLDAGLRTDPLFARLPGERCQCARWGYIISGTIPAHGADRPPDDGARATCHTGPGLQLRRDNEPG